MEGQTGMNVEIDWWIIILEDREHLQKFDSIDWMGDNNYAHILKCVTYQLQIRNE